MQTSVTSPPYCIPNIEDDRTGVDVNTLRRAILDNLLYIQGKLTEIATQNDFYLALAYTVRDRLLNRWLNSVQTYLKGDVKTVCYFSVEFILRPHLGNNLINLGIFEPIQQAITESGLNLQTLAYTDDQGNYRVRWIPGYVVKAIPYDKPILGYKVNTANNLRLWRSRLN